MLGARPEKGLPELTLTGPSHPWQASPSSTGACIGTWPVDRRNARRDVLPDRSRCPGVPPSGPPGRPRSAATSRRGATRSCRSRSGRGPFARSPRDWPVRPDPSPWSSENHGCVELTTSYLSLCVEVCPGWSSRSFQPKYAECVVRRSSARKIEHVNHSVKRLHKIPMRVKKPCRRNKKPHGAEDSPRAAFSAFSSRAEPLHARRNLARPAQPHRRQRRCCDRATDHAW